MPELTREEIRECFLSSTNFNEIFDAFQTALQHRIDDVEIYRTLFWNGSLSADEIILFGEKLAKEYPHIAYDVYVWMANVFEAFFASRDNFEHALEYYQKAALANPAIPDPYLDACDCYESDLNIPPLEILIEFVKKGLETVTNKKSLYSRLSYLYQLLGDKDLADYYRFKANEAGDIPPQ
jgi:tetratricopeptide (TPR) repeat protein